jgi:hypothetical protein
MNDHQREFLRQLDLTNPALTIPAPIRIAHAQPDNRVGIAGTNTLIGELGALDNDITYRIYPQVADGAGLGPHFGMAGWTQWSQVEEVVPPDIVHSCDLVW